MFKNLAIAGLLGSALGSQLSSGQLTPLGTNDKDFIVFAAETDLATARFGQMARERALSDKVKQFGQMMKQEHAENLKTLNSIAAKTGALVPDTLDVKRMKTLSSLRRAKVKSFDHQYLKSVVNQHENALESFRQEAEHSSNQDLAAYAKDTLPKLEEHLKEAKELAASEK